MLLRNRIMWIGNCKFMLLARAPGRYVIIGSCALVSYVFQRGGVWIFLEIFSPKNSRWADFFLLDFINKKERYGLGARLSDEVADMLGFFF